MLSVAVHVTVVVPTGNVDAALLVTLSALPQMSTAVAVPMLVGAGSQAV